MNIQKPAQKYFSPEEYLALEEIAEYKSEYYQGEIFAMAGASINHNQIVGNIYADLHQKQNNHKCRVMISELKLWIEEIDLFTYSDLMVICDISQFYPGRNDTIINPLIIIEVLSKSTEAHDRGKKFQFYRSISTFQEYILIGQYSVHIDQSSIGSEGKWVFNSHNDVNDILKFSTINFGISLKKVYNLVDFELEESE